MEQKVAIITGASSGIGKATAELLSKNDYYVFALARRTHRLETILSTNIEPITLDVTDADAVEAAIRHIITTKKRIDVLVNNAGFGQLGAVEHVPMEAARYQFEVNVFGYARFMQAVLPHMRHKKSGCIINISSVLGKFAIPGFGWYAASKHAVEALTEAVRGEVKNFGIKVIMIAPGLIKTEFVTKEFELLKSINHSSEYNKVLQGAHEIVSNEPYSPGPEIIASAILKIIEKNSSAIRYAIPLDSKAAVMSRWIFGDRLFAWFIYKIMKI
jgi:short-subunit dehydrogenase